MPPAPPGDSPAQPHYGAPEWAAPETAGNVAQAHSGLVAIPGLGTVKVATIGQRFLARLIDGVLLVVTYFALSAALGGVLAAGSTATVDPVTGEADAEAVGALLGASFLIFFLMIVAALLYEVVMIALKGATVGKMIIGLKVVKQENGQVPGFGPSFIRWVIPAVASLLCGIGQILVYLSPLFDKSGRMQGWHDNAANDLVISTK